MISKNSVERGTITTHASPSWAGGGRKSEYKSRPRAENIKQYIYLLIWRAFVLNKGMRLYELDTCVGQPALRVAEHTPRLPVPWLQRSQKDSIVYKGRRHRRQPTRPTHVLTLVLTDVAAMPRQRLVTLANSTSKRLEEYNTVDGRLAATPNNQHYTKPASASEKQVSPTPYETRLRIGKASLANAARGHHMCTPMPTACEKMSHPRHD